MIVWIICFVVVVGFAIWAISVNAQKVQGELDAVYEKMGHQIIKLTHVHASALARKREQGMYRDDYGNEVNEVWFRECRYFYESIICADSTFNQLNNESLYLQTKVGRPIRDEEHWFLGVFNMVDAIVIDVPLTTNSAITGQDYELVCARILEESAWIVRRTGRSGDQGVDLVAELNGISVAIQCKYYSSPVGNAAVQEIIAGKVFEKADHAAVVSNAAYTPAARQLASSAGVLLLHHDQLSQLSEMVVG